MLRDVLTYIVKMILLMSPSLILLRMLLMLFPNTGLGLIVALPFSVVMNIAVVILGLTVSNKLNRFGSTFIWIVVIVLTMLITVGMYPQDDASNIWDKWDKRSQPVPHF